MRYTITIASIRKSAVAAATNPLHGMSAAARQAESATVGKMCPGAADRFKNLRETAAQSPENSFGLLFFALFCNNGGGRNVLVVKELYLCYTGSVYR